MASPNIVPNVEGELNRGTNANVEAGSIAANSPLADKKATNRLKLSVWADKQSVIVSPNAPTAAKFVALNRSVNGPSIKKEAA